VVDVQERSLRAFEQNVVAAAQGLVQQHDRVGDEPLEVNAGGPVIVMDFLKESGFAPNARRISLFSLILSSSFSRKRSG